METEEAKQLVILGNGFDLNLGLKTTFEDYMKRFYFYDEEKKLDNLFKDLIDWSGCTVENLEKNNMNEGDWEDKVYEISGCIDDIEINSEEKKLVSNFYFKVMRNQLESKAIDEVKKWKKLDSKNSIKYDNRIDLLEWLSEEMRYKMNHDTTDKSENKKQLNFWDLYLLYLRKKDLNKDSNWSDVEAQILTFYERSNNEPSKYNELVSRSNETLYIIYETLTGKMVNPNDIDNFLYNELLSFSQNFVDYLKNQCSNYYDKNDDKLNDRWKFIDEKIADNKKYELLNFNYTNAEGNKCIKQIHIHGKMQSEKDEQKEVPIDEVPIIGINAEDLKSNKKHAFKLTKQYQLISNKNNKIERLDLENIDRIIFYGHSLALADYQYFRNIFDRINLVKSSVQLIFKYSKGYEIYDSIFELLDHYSKEVGVDIATTLTLENRLKVEELPD